MTNRTRMPLFSSLHNFRDVGGYPTADSRSVRTARLYRSDTLAKLSEDEMHLFADLGIRTIIDLQRPSEIDRLGRIPDAPGRRYINIAPDYALWDVHAYDEAAGPDRFLADRYLDMARDGRAGFKAALGVLADESAAPAVVHCFAGKDRTGVLVALTLELLGVTDECICDDYARSEEWARRFAPTHIPAHWTGAPRDAMMTFLVEMRRDYGSVERYFAGAGITSAQFSSLRAHLLA